MTHINSNVVEEGIHLTLQGGLGPTTLIRVTHAPSPTPRPIVEEKIVNFFFQVS
jgi:hypothetical protein